MKRIINIAVIGMVCVTLSAHAMDRMKALQEKQNARKTALIAKDPKKAELFTSLGVNLEKVKKSVQARGEKLNYLAEKTSVLQESTDVFKESIKKLKSIPIANKVKLTVSYNNGNPTPSVPNDNITTTDITENTPLIAPKQIIIIEKEKPEPSCFDFFGCCNEYEEESTSEAQIN